MISIVSKYTYATFQLTPFPSLPLQTKRFHSSPDEPGKPGTPEIVDWDRDHVDLKWDKPISDGGAPITGYVIEKREVGSNKWVKACEVSTDMFKKGFTCIIRFKKILT